jgi:hypothetical protein
MAGKSANSFGAKNWSPGPPSTRYNVSGKNHDFYTFENAPGLGAYATGGTIIDGGDGYIYHIFTGAGTFQVNRPPAAIDSVDYLIVAGGGGGGAFGGGGGAGGLRFGSASVGIGSYPIAVGGGGSGSGTAPTRNGNPSSAFGLTATGGGGGGTPGSPNPTFYPGAPGGSGGGGYGAAPVSGSPGIGDTPPTIPRQGYSGAFQPGPGGPNNGGGGGGAGGPGYVNLPTASPTKGVGGPGRVVSEFPAQIVSKAFSNIPTWYSEVNTNGFARGGYGWSGNPSPNTPTNTGYGSPGTGPVAAAGASGIVCVRYKKTAAYQRATGGTIEPNTHPEHPGVWRHIFTSPGDFTITDPTLQWVDYLAVGGGGGGGGSPAFHGGGGGGGGFVSSIHTSPTTPAIISDAYPWNPGYSVQVGEQMPVGVGTYPIGIGTGGNAATAGNNTTIGVPGANQIIAYGGGAGATAPGNGGNGASGGGGAKPFPSAVAATGGTATPSPNIQGNAGNGSGTLPSAYVAGGGGGSGGTSTPGTVYPGGPGWYSVLSPSAYGTPGPLTPTSIYRYFGGGGGGVFSPGTNPVAGGVGGGGAGNVSSPNSGTPGTTNTGGGGGGGFGGTGGGTGGPGIVIIQYPE